MGSYAGKISPPVSEKSTLVNMTPAQIITMIPTSKCDSLVSGCIYIYIYIYVYVCVCGLYLFIYLINLFIELFIYLEFIY
jgi:hypothetical protein